MSIASYPRTIQNGQIASNGNANSGTGLMLWDSTTNTYIAATPSTFSGGSGGATAANQTTQIGYESTIATNTTTTATNGATAANQTSQISIANTLNSNVATSANQTTLNGLVATATGQTTQTAALNAQTNGGVLSDTCYNIVLSTTSTGLTGVACKYVTLINSSSNAKVQYQTVSSSVFLNLEAGYSVKLNINNGGSIFVKQTTGENQTLEYIITS
jgi:hypothetical protein